MTLTAKFSSSYKEYNEITLQLQQHAHYWDYNIITVYL